MNNAVTKTLMTGAMLAIALSPALASPHKSTSQAALQKQAKITMADAEKTALAKEPGTIKSRELEKEKGKLIYSFDVQTAAGIHEVNVDAVKGDVVEDSVENAADEAKEKKQDAKAAHHKAKAAAKTK